MRVRASGAVRVPGVADVKSAVITALISPQPHTIVGPDGIGFVDVVGAVASVELASVVVAVDGADSRAPRCRSCRLPFLLMVPSTMPSTHFCTSDEVTSTARMCPNVGRIQFS